MRAVTAAVLGVGLGALQVHYGSRHVPWIDVAEGVGLLAMLITCFVALILWDKHRMDTFRGGL